MSRLRPLLRLMRRPSVADWTPDDQMTLAEYIAVFWPDGPLTVASLRTAIARGHLPFARVRGMLWVTPAAVETLFAAKGGSATARIVAGGAGPTPSKEERMRKAMADAHASCENLIAASRRKPAS